MQASLAAGFSGALTVMPVANKRFTWSGSFGCFMAAVVDESTPIS
jgi:hypothetical protein